ncbi:iron-sulfur cluster-binding domain-containing protein [Flaviaesturariibacter flavus]|uniref:Iron-sulfur cluster-binding domain-containing protein n=1 Tax=Flaviaesturariibacter flavus TaxID=2502780 RepID=A0A4V6NAY2_9BACT|nr:iron-sulfur cluster-binding domain-containing protein [Flaviaesturariibacter flavus]TCJ13296.1 iron-sulfur cluster-binding domain-containing protein [Flaviaesturariibacter flavus]
MPALLPLTITDIREEAPGFRTITFAERLPYAAGQFLTFEARLGGQTVRRSYSLLSSPAFDEPLTIGVRRIANGIFSRHLFENIHPGDQLWTAGATGRFQLPPDDAPPATLFFFAAGTGITPVLSLLRTALATRPRWRALLVYSSHDRSDALFLPLLQQLAADHPRAFTLHLLFSTDPNLRRARLNRPLLLELLQAAGARTAADWFYTCGPENYMRLCTFVLRTEGVPANRLRREDFLPAPAPPPPAHPGLQPRAVTVETREGSAVVTVVPPETILKAALRAGLSLPWSCAAGRCGACTARCASGHVWMARNEVLTDADLEKGLVLTCTAFPLDDGVRILTY